MPKDPGHERSVIGAYSEDHGVNSSREHLTKPPAVSLPHSPQNDSGETVQDAGYPAEKHTSRGAHSGSTSGTEVDQRDPVTTTNNIHDPSYSSHSPMSHTDALPTSAGPPIGEPHAESLEMGTIGAQPDPINEDVSDPYFAVPGGAGVLQDEDEDENDPNAFFHPATKEPMRVLWLPKDELGLCDAEIEGNKAMGIDAVHRFATLNAKVRTGSLLRCFPGS